jgi:hypothetical protein
MKLHVFAAALIVPLASAFAFAETPIPKATSQTPYTGPKIEGRYYGPWVTLKNKKLDGTCNADIKQLARDRWEGRFWGVWMQVPFDYTVEFDRVKTPPHVLETAEVVKPKKVSHSTESGPVHVVGKAMIDGASYDWAGTLSFKQFDIQFTGSRYEGHMEMARVPEKKTEK